MAELDLILLHHPVLDKNGLIVTTALTNMDIHDIARSARFVRPDLVAEVEFAGWTGDGLVRHGVFKGLSDRSPEELMPVSEAGETGSAKAKARPKMTPTAMGPQN